MKCENCGNENEDGALYCTNCGMKLDIPSFDDASEGEAPTVLLNEPEPEETKPEDLKSEETKPEDPEPEEMKTEEAESEQPKEEQTVKPDTEEADAEETDIEETETASPEAVGTASEPTEAADTEGTETASPAAAASQAQNTQADPDGKKKSKTALIIVIIVVAVILLMLLCCCAGVLFAFLKSGKKTTVDLNKYLHVETSGYDGYGTASVYFDYVAFEDDYGKKIDKWNARADRKETDTTHDFEYELSYYISQDYYLSNGDTIECDWMINESYLEELYGIEIECEPYVYTVENLTAMKDLYGEDLLDYAIISYTGNDGAGTADVFYDYDGFNAEYGTDFTENDYIFSGYLSASTSYLSNGDVVSLTWYASAERLAMYGLNLLETEGMREYTVEGLAELTEINAFDDLELKLEGISGDARLTLELGDETVCNQYGGFYFSASDSYDLSNGDVVSITLYPYVSERSLAADYGIKYAPMELQYTIEGLDEYVSLDEMDADLVESLNLKDYAEEEIRSMVKNNMSDATINSLAYKGACYLTKTAGYGDQNMLYLLYEVKVKASKETKTFYTYVEFTDFIRPGSLSEETEVYYDDEIKNAYDNYDSFYTNGQRYYGFESLEDMQDEITNGNDIMAENFE